MPTKRLSPSSDMGDAGELPIKRTHRTHEENQERAYIAASRRADRDIEHRYASALKASECRKRRTGRGLKITREAVMGDEQYESEEDDRPTRRFSMPAATTIPTAGGTLPNSNNTHNNNNTSDDMNGTNSILSRSADRYAEVDALFAKHFPYFAKSRYAAPQPQAQVQRHSYPQLVPPPPPLQPPYLAYVQQQRQQQQQQDVSSVLGAAQGSPLLTPPTSTPLPPEREGKAGSVSPLTLEGAQSRRGSVAAAQQAAVGLGMALADAGAGGAGGYLVDDAVDAQGGYLAGSGASAQMMSAVDFSSAAAAAAAAAGAGDLTWYAGGDALPGMGGSWHSRSYSLPSALEQFQFDVEPAADLTTAGVVPPVPATAALIDPAILPPDAVPATDVSSAEGATAVGSTPPSEPWSDWINLDGDGPQPLGVKV